MQLEELSAIELGSLVNERKVSPTEVVKYFESRIDARNDSINAFTYTKFEEAEQAAADLEKRISSNEEVGPLAGVPIALKDFLPSKKGWTHSHGGVRSIADKVDDYSSPFTEACESMGAISLGKTNAPAFGFRGLTDNHMYGPTSTPFNPLYNSGGSSGGSCSAVSAGLVLAAEQGDAGGSARCPAAWCGCFGFKPSAGIVPSICRPDAWTATHPYCCGSPATKTVDDAALILNAMIGYSPDDPISVITPENLKDLRRYKNILQNSKPLAGMKIGVTYDFKLFPTPVVEIRNAIDTVLRLLEGAGAEVITADFQFNHDREEIEDAWLRGICIDTAVDMELWKRDGYDLPKDHSDEVASAFLKWNDIAIHSTMMDYRKFHEVRTDILDAHNRVFKDCDIIIAPVSGCMQILNSHVGPDGLVIGPDYISGEPVDPLIGFCYTYLENMIGTPAASIPAALSSDNLPVGVQVIGRRYHDDDVLKVCYFLESANPWRHWYLHSFN